MNIAKIQTLTSLVGYHEGEVEEAQRKLASIRSELTKAENALVGANEALRDARMALAKARAQLPVDEVTHRERDIARMLGMELTVGAPLDYDQWANICAKRSS